MGLASQERMEKVVQKQKQIKEIKNGMAEMLLEPDDVNAFLDDIGSARIKEKQRLDKIILRPNVYLKDMGTKIPKINNALSEFDTHAIEQAEIQVKYQVYIDKENELVQRMSQLENLAIPVQFDYQRITALGVEAKEKLIKGRPTTLGQASRISGINPSDVQILMVYMGR
jgi:tRNA uridine 5-carboxymethylaminomethyl modification enzyme